MIQQLMAANRFIPLATDDPDDSDTDIEPMVPCITEKTREDASANSNQSIYFDALEAACLSVYLSICLSVYLSIYGAVSFSVM